MAAPLSTAPIPGTRDFFPDEMSVRQQVFDALYRVVENPAHNPFTSLRVVGGRANAPPGR